MLANEFQRIPKGRIFPTIRLQNGNAFSRLCLRVCTVRPLTFETFETFDIQTSFSVCRYTSSEYLCYVRKSESSDQGQGHRSKKSGLCVLFAGGMYSTERRTFKTGPEHW